MELSKVIIDDFAKVTNDDRHISQNTTLYGTIKVNGDKNYVQLDGSDLLTPCSSSVNVKDGERVMVIVGGHEAVVTGNMSSPAARLGDVDDAKKEIGDTVDKSLDAYDVKLAQMNELAANTLGFYYTEEKAADGSIIAYRHDKAELSESKIIYKNGIDGFFLSVDGGQTWKAGFDSNGDAVLNILYAIGIQSKWINTRGFTATDNSGKETFKIDENTGSVYIDPNTFMLGDKGIADTINGIVSDASTVFMLLSNEYQGIATDSDGNVVGDFPNCQTTITIMSGNDDVTAEATIQPTLRKGIIGEWDAETFTYTVTGLTEDNCYIEFTALYNDSTVKRRFTVCKQRYGKDGENAVSPVVSVEKKDGKTIISITDKTGTHTQEVLDGVNGTPGPKGEDGKTTYFHVKYSNDGGKTFTSNSGETVGAYIGTCTDYNVADPTSVGSYIWAKIKGDDGRDGTNGTNGKDGKGISKIQTFYQANNSTSGIYTYTSGWSEVFTAPSSSSKYLWTYQKTTYTDGSTETTTPHIIGTYGKDGKDGSTLSSSEIWNLLLQQNTDFMYKGSDGKIYLKATYIDTGDFCGWQADRINKRLTATATDSGSDGDIDLSYGGQITLDASKAMVKTETPYGVYGGYDYAALCGNQVVANTAKIFSFLNNATFSKSITAEGSITGKNGLSISIGNVIFNKKLNVGDRLTVLEQIYAPNIPVGSGYTLYLTSGGFIKKSSSSKRYKKHVSFINDTDVKKLYELRPVYFNYKEGILDDDNEDCHRTIPGFYAELVDKYFPEAVVHDEKGRVDDWDVRKLVPAMLKLIQLQKEQLDRQEERLSKIESILNIKEE